MNEPDINQIIKRLGHQTHLAYLELNRSKPIKLRHEDYEAMIDVNNEAVVTIQRLKEIINENALIDKDSSR